MSRVKWRISLLFAVITLSIFSSLMLSSDRIIENSENATTTTSVAGVSGENHIINLINRLETGNNETRLNTAAEIGRLGGPAASALIEKIETEKTGEVEEIETGNSSS